MRDYSVALYYLGMIKALLNDMTFPPNKSDQLLVDVVKSNDMVGACNRDQTTVWRLNDYYDHYFKEVHP